MASMNWFFEFTNIKATFFYHIYNEIIVQITIISMESVSLTFLMDEYSRSLVGKFKVT